MEKLKTLTIFTPTYNRSYILPMLYKSLLDQTTNDFVWLIVDDGSTDDTEQLVNNWLEQHSSCFEIFYYKQSNKGKMQAHNLGVNKAETELFMCVDSDDYLEKDAVEKIVNFWKSVKYKRTNLCGIISPRRMLNVDYNSLSLIPLDIEFTTMNALLKSAYKGETAITFVTSIIKKYPFPQIENEKFITEDYIYCQIDDDYIYAILKYETVVCEYKNDGYTKNINKIMAENPRGYSLYYNEKAKRAKSLGSIKFTVVKYIVFSLLSGFSILNIMRKTYRPFFTFLLLPLGYLQFLKLKKYTINKL